MVTLGSAHDLVKATWKGVNWNEALHNGVVPNTKYAEVKATAKAPALPAKPAGQGLEVTWYPSSTVFDGRFLNNGWMQETPDVYDQAGLGATPRWSAPRRPGNWVLRTAT